MKTEIMLDYSMCIRTLAVLGASSRVTKEAMKEEVAKITKDTLGKLMGLGCSPIEAAKITLDALQNGLGLSDEDLKKMGL